MIFTIITRYFPPVYDIATFKRKFHSILHAECSAYVFQLQNKPKDTQLAFIRRIYGNYALYLSRLRYFDV